eukprot:scaffold23627_cov60-Phaeocystis_antarctica.AAC.4
MGRFQVGGGHWHSGGRPNWEHSSPKSAAGSAAVQLERALGRRRVDQHVQRTRATDEARRAGDAQLHR